MEAQGWHTLAEVAKKLDCSVDTVRRRLKKGEFQARQQNTNHGKVWLVNLGEVPKLEPSLNEAPAQDAQVAAQIETEHKQGLVELIRIVEKLQEENRALAEAACSWQGRAEVLILQLGQAQQTIKMLEAPKEELMEEIKPEEGSEEESLPWWRRWLQTFG